MVSSTRLPEEGRAATAAPSQDRVAGQLVAARVRDALEGVFAVVADTATDTAALLDGLAADPTTDDLAALRPALHARLAGHPLVSGIGFVAAPGLLRDVPAWLEWWQTGTDGGVRPLLLDLTPERSAYADYTHWEWYALPRDTGRRAVAGPYVDYLCSDEYSLTLSAPVRSGGRFVGVAAVDVYLRHFEGAVMPLLQRLPGPAHLVNARGRVAASADSRHLAGSLTKGADFAALLDGRARPGRRSGRELYPCDGVPLVLVVSRP
ncbi:cache domain-containing protein [Streptomyces sp. NPDC002004]